MQHALVALSGEGILGLGQIEGHCAIFHCYGVSRPDEKVFDCSDQSFRIHIQDNIYSSVMSDHSPIWDNEIIVPGAFSALATSNKRGQK